MRFMRRFLPVLMLVLTLLPAGIASAQELPSLPTAPPPEGGYCAPWHRCAAYLGLGMAGVAVLLFGVGYLVQSRGFDKLEHKQGNPDGVPVGKD